MSLEESGSLHQDQPQVVEPGTLAKYSQLFSCSKIFQIKFIRLEKLSEEQITKVIQEHQKYWVANKILERAVRAKYGRHV